MTALHDAIEICFNFFILVILGSVYLPYLVAEKITGYKPEEIGTEYSHGMTMLRHWKGVDSCRQ